MNPKSSQPSQKQEVKSHLQNLSEQISEVQYDSYLNKVEILSQKKQFLKAFRGQLESEQKKKLVLQIKSAIAEMTEIEAKLFRQIS